jgi:exopolysaccharide production protein ExoQ
MYNNVSALPYGNIESSALELGQDNIGHKVQIAFIAFACLLATTVFLAPFESSWNESVTYLENLNQDHVDPGARDGRLDKQLALGTLGLFGLVGLACRGEKTLRNRGVLFLAFAAYLAWCGTTCLWSDDVALTVRRWTALMCEVAAAMAVAKHCTARQFVWIVFVCTSAWLCLGIGAELAHGAFQPGREGYRFAGVFHPNNMGVNCALLIMSALYLATGEQRAGKWLYLCASVAGVFLLETGSRTALAAMLASFFVAWFFVAPSARKLGIATVLLLVVAFGWIASGPAVFGDRADLVSLGRTDSDPSSITGRVPLWQELLSDYLPRHQLVGYGYGAFWSEDRIVEVSHSQGWSVPHAHSSYIDFVLNTGYVGAVLCIVTLLSALFLVLGLESRYTRDGFGFVAMVVIFAMTGSLSETYIGISWFLSFFLLCGIGFLLFRDEQGPSQISTSVFN